MMLKMSMSLMISMRWDGDLKFPLVNDSVNLFYKWRSSKFWADNGFTAQLQHGESWDDKAKN